MDKVQLATYSALACVPDTMLQPFSKKEDIFPGICF
jgi:hypothetical protein